MIKKREQSSKKIISGINATLKLMSISGGAITRQKYKIERGYQRLRFIKRYKGTI